MRQPPTQGASLPLIHCTTADICLRILDAREISPRHCPVYDDDLLYLFYGRPAYKPGSGNGASGILDLAPVCLVMDPTILGPAIRILPFDSGGYSHYAPLVGPNLSLQSFEMGPDPTAPMRLVHAYYETNARYYEQRPQLSEADLPFSQLAARAYARLLADPAMRSTDDRCGTVEIQLTGAIPLSSALRAIVAPAAVLDDPMVVEVLSECPNATPLPYKTYGRSDPLSFAHALYERVETLLRDQGALE